MSGTTVVFDNGASIDVEVARSPSELTRGLSGKSAPRAMLFDFGRVGAHRMWMRGVEKPLDVVFVGPAGEVLEIVPGTPRSEEHLGTKTSAFVLELPVAWTELHGVKLGARCGWKAPSCGCGCADGSCGKKVGAGAIVRVGAGQGLADFNALLATDPHGFGAAWGDISKQLASEGASQTAIVGAQTALASSFSTLSSQLGVDGNQALAAAKEYVIAGNTIAGAAENVVGLIQHAHGIPPAQLITSFTGTLIGVAGALGAVTAGVGAAITGAVGGLLAILQGAGLFGDTPSGTQVCPGFTCNGQAFTVTTRGPSGQIGCCCVSQQPDQPPRLSPASPLWRTFPDALVGGDAGWLTSANWRGLWALSWKGGTFTGPGVPITSTSVVRPIDVAFPQYRTLECNIAQSVATDPVGAFMRAYFTAWKLNAAYALNGLQTQDDAQVLLHTLRLWNRAHEPGDGAVIVPATGDLVGQNETCVPGDSTKTLYISLLVTNAVGAIASDESDLVDASGNLVLHTGKLKYLVRITPVGTLGGRTPGSLQTAAKPPMSTGAKVAIGVGVAGGLAVAGTVAYAYATDTAIGLLLKGAWGAVTSGFGHATAALGMGAGEATEAAGSWETQSVLVPRDKYTLTEAKSWVRAHGHKVKKVDVTAHYYRFRQRSPSHFKKGSHRTIRFGSSGVKAVRGRLK